MCEPLLAISRNLALLFRGTGKFERSYVIFLPRNAVEVTHKLIMQAGVVRRAYGRCQKRREIWL